MSGTTPTTPRIGRVHHNLAKPISLPVAFALH